MALYSDPPLSNCLIQRFIICLIIVAMILLNLALIIFFLQRTRSLKKIVKRLPNQEKFSKRVIIPERVETKPVENLQDTESKFAMEAFMANNKYRVSFQEFFKKVYKLI